MKLITAKETAENSSRTFRRYHFATPREVSRGEIVVSMSILA